MKTLLVNLSQYSGAPGKYVIREECAAGVHNHTYLPAQIFLAANYLRERGRDVDAIDAQTSRISLNGYDVVVVWVVVLGNFYKDIEFLKKAKMEGKKTVMILNDAYEGFEMEAMRRFGFIDATVRLWEREIVLDRLLSSWEIGENPNFVGVMYRKNDSIVDKGEMQPLPSLEHLHCYSKLIESLPLERYKSAVVVPGRGCPIGCTFCLYRNTRIRNRRIKDVVSEFETISTSIQRVLILDPALPAHPQWTRKFCHELAEKNLGVSWRTDARTQECNLRLLSVLKRSGCDTIMIGIETLDEEIAGRIKAGTNHKELKKAVKNLRRTSIIPKPVFYLGFLWDSNETLLKIKNFLKEVPIPHFELRYARPWRGTPYYDECKRTGNIEMDLGLDDYIHSGLRSPLIDTLFLTKEEVTQWGQSIRKSAMLNLRFVLQSILERRDLDYRSIVKDLISMASDVSLTPHRYCLQKKKAIPPESSIEERID
jgi:radical SAM superfamily enzyme YgiQ (UPF0313 family)